MGRDDSLADLAWETFCSGKVWGTHGYEVFESMLALCENESVKIERANQVLSDPNQSEENRFHAVYALGKLNAGEQITDNLHYLTRQPITNWALHIALIDHARDLELPLPDLSHLAEVDNLDLQESLSTCGKTL